MREDAIHLLFAYRSIFHQIATTQVDDISSTGIIYSWVDVVLSKIGDSVQRIVANFSQQAGEEVSLTRRPEIDGIRIASQLPGLFHAPINPFWH